MQKRSLNEVFAKIQAQHVRQFGTSNQTHVLGGEEGAEEATQDLDRLGAAHTPAHPPKQREATDAWGSVCVRSAREVRGTT